MKKIYPVIAAIMTACLLGGCLRYDSNLLVHTATDPTVTKTVTEESGMESLPFAPAETTAEPTTEATTEEANTEEWTVKSGYGIGIVIVNGIKTVSGCATPASSAYTNAQYAVATFPEFKYRQTANNCRTLQLVSGQWIFRQNDTYGKIHFTPLWYPDGSYTVHVIQSDMWTPAGMITRIANSNAITISGSAYDDWSI